MSKDQKQSSEQKAVNVLKEVNRKIKYNPGSYKSSVNQPSAEETAEELKGSDADVDQDYGTDNQNNTK